MSPLKPVLLIIIIGLLVWLFFWPLVECIYALSIDPLFAPMHKFYLFIVGGIVLIISVIHGRKLLV